MSFDLKRVSAIGGISTAAKTIPGVSGLLGDTPIGEFLGLSTKNIWRLKLKDDKSSLKANEFKGQFVAENYTENIGSRLSNQKGLNQQNADIKYISGDDETVNFTTRLWATNSIKNIKSSVDQLKAFTKRDPVLKRSPIFIFTSGTELQFTCFVKSIGGVSYDIPRSDGSIRGATFNVTLEKIDDLQPKSAGLSLASLVKSGLGLISAAQGITSGLGLINIPFGSLHRKGRKIITKQGQTFEHIAQLEYGDALVGDILRRIHFQNPLNQIKPALETGDIVDLVHEDEIHSIPITPTSVALKDETIVRQNIQAHLELRGVARTIYV